MADYSHLSPENTDVVIVNWPDIQTVANWNEDEEPDIVTVSTLGWILEDDPKWIKVAGSYSWEAEQWSDIHSFPRHAPGIVVIYAKKISAP